MLKLQQLGYQLPVLDQEALIFSLQYSSRIPVLLRFRLQFLHLLCEPEILIKKVVVFARQV